MERFRVYIALLIINVLILIFSVVFKFQDFAGILNFISFVASIIYFLFSVEEPPKASKLGIPEVHNYYRSRQNDYGNIVSIEFGILSFMFFLLVYSTQLSLGFIVIILWVISVPITYFIIYKTSKNLQINKIIDYVKFVRPDIDTSFVNKTIKSLSALNTKDKKKLLLVKSSNKLLLTDLVNIYLTYLDALDSQLTSGEIEEINSL